MKDEYDRQIEALLGKEPEDTYTFYNMRDFTMPYVDNMEAIFTNYKRQFFNVFENAITVLRKTSKTKPQPRTRRIAIVGPSGSGKSTMVRFVLQKLEKYSERLDTGHPKFISVKKIPKSLLRQEIKDTSDLSRKIVIIDDMHELLSIDDKEDQFNYILQNIFSARLEKSFIITTWLPYGWLHAINNYPEIVNSFDEILVLKGLEEKDARKMIASRLKYFSDTEGENTHPFDDSAINCVIKKVRTPELILSILEDALISGFKKKSLRINKSHVAEVLKEEKVDAILEISEKLPEALKRTLIACLFQTDFSVYELQTLLSRDRSNISTYLQELIKKKLIYKCQSSHYKENKKKQLYHVAGFYRYKKEMEVMEEIERKFCRD